MQVPHRAVVNFLTTMAQKPGFRASDAMLAVTTLSFDIAVLELFLPLVCGGRVVVAGRDRFRTVLPGDGASVPDADAPRADRSLRVR